MTAYVWTLAWFDPDTERLVGEKVFGALSDLEVTQILAMTTDEVLAGEFEAGRTFFVDRVFSWRYSHPDVTSPTDRVRFTSAFPG